MCKLRLGENINQDSFVYRYFSIESFIYLLESNNLTFTHVTEWDDPWENILSNSITEKNDGTFEKAIYKASDYIYGQCWTRKEESDAMWRIYSPQKTGVKIRVPLKKFELIEGSEFLDIENVIYFSNMDDLVKKTNADKSRFSTAKIKRDAFSHEEEIRIFTHPDYLGRSIKNFEKRVNLSINIESFIDSVVIDPRAEEWVQDMIKKYCARLLPNCLVSKSDLYEVNDKIQFINKYVPV